MRRFPVSLFLLVTHFALSISFGAADSEPMGRALLVANSHYKLGPLLNPKHDALLIAQHLKEIDFVVDVELELSKAQMVSSIANFHDTLHTSTSSGPSLIYFAGHGIEVDGINYLIPVDAELASPAKVTEEAIPAQQLLSGNMPLLLVLDACRNNPFASGEGKRSFGLSRMDVPEGSVVV